MALSLSKFRNASNNSRLATALQSQFSNAISLSSDYFLFHNQRSQGQWVKGHAETRALLDEASMHFSLAEDKASIAELMRYTKESQLVFDRAIANSENLKASSKVRTMREELDKRLLSQLLLKLSTARDIVEQLIVRSNRNAEKAYHQLALSMMALAIAMAFVTSLILIFIVRLLKTRLAVLHEGTQRVAGGELNFRLASNGDDELSDVARSINLMTTRLQANTEALERIAHFDALTGLSNRVMLTDRLQQSLLHAKRNHKSLALAYLDLDGFKAVNDQHGHDVGDRLLVELAQRMRIALREGDTLARLGGDEFVAILSDLDQPDECVLVLERLLATVSNPVAVEGHLLRVTTSIGVAVFPRDGTEADYLMRRADQAMYVAKEAGKSRFHFFDAVRDTAVQSLRENIEEIKIGFQRGELVLYYEPKVNMRSGEVVGVEALIRWNHPTRGLVPPLSFLPIIENHVLGLDIGEWVLRSALQQMVAWQKAGLKLTICVNITAHQLQQTNFVERLTALIKSVPESMPELLQLEVVETSSLTNLSQVSSTMLACCSLGVRFALDDFGTGYSSLTYLQKLPVNFLKIDQSFVRDMLDDDNDLAIVQGVIGLAKAFDLEVVAEGVESKAHGEALMKLGCEIAQGYGIARPMPGVEIANWVTQQISGSEPTWLMESTITS